MLCRLQKSQSGLPERRIFTAKHGPINRLCSKKHHVFLHGSVQRIQSDSNGTKGRGESYFQDSHKQFLLHHFWLKDMGATYQHTMMVIFHDMMHHELKDYVDDIVVKLIRREDHVKTLRKVFKRCRTFKLRMNPLKCAFGVSSGKFLGFLVHSRE